MKLYNKKTKIKAANDNFYLNIEIRIYNAIEFAKKGALKNIISRRPIIEDLILNGK